MKKFKCTYYTEQELERDLDIYLRKTKFKETILKDIKNKNFTNTPGLIISLENDLFNIYAIITPLIQSISLDRSLDFSTKICLNFEKEKLLKAYNNKNTNAKKIYERKSIYSEFIKN